MNKRDEKELSKGSIILIYVVLVIIIAVMAMATLIKYDIIFQDVKNSEDITNDDIIPDDKNFEMTCTYNRVEDKLKIDSTIIFTFEDSNLKHFNGKESYRLFNPNEGFGALTIQLESYQYMKEQYKDVDGIKWDIEEGNNSFIATIDVDLTKIDEEQLADEYGVSMSENLHLDQTIDEVKTMVSKNGEVSCDR